jgi:hypothetical protein
MRWLANAMRRAADRIDHAGAPKDAHLYFTFEDGKGIVIHGLNGEPEPVEPRGCRLWVLNDDEYVKAHIEAERPGVWVDWKSGVTYRLDEEVPLP